MPCAQLKAGGDVSCDYAICMFFGGLQWHVLLDLVEVRQNRAWESRPEHCRQPLARHTLRISPLLLLHGGALREMC